MPKKFEFVGASIEETKDLSMMSVEYLMESLVSHESRISRYEENTLEIAFKDHLSMSKIKHRGIKKKG